MNELISFLKNQDVEYQLGKKLSLCTSIGIGGSARIIISPNSKEKLTKTLDFLSKNKISHCIVGNMSNILPSDCEVKTVLVSTLRLNKYALAQEQMFAEAGALFSRVILFGCNSSLGGCEALFGIPGTVGAMLSLNAGAYGAVISDFLDEVELYDPSNGTVFKLKKEDIGFFYRDSEIKRQRLTVLSATFNFLRTEKREINFKIQKIKERRLDTQPIGFKTLGSVFKKSDTFPASYMIDRCGLKGERVGNIHVSEKHAGFFINDGGGTAKDFLKLAELVKNRVNDKYGVILEEEFEYLI